MTSPVIETVALAKRFGRKEALSDFDLTVERGGIHAVVGSNGAGKSTLFRLLLGVLTPNEGSARLLGQDSRQLSPRTRGKIGYVNEEHTLPGWMSAKGVTEFQRHYYPNWNQHIYDFVIGHFDVDPKQRVHQLSRGERAGLNLAIAFAQRPELLILDEPTLGLDVVAKQSFLEAVMFTETDDDITIIYCSHEMDEIERVSDRLIIMESGELRNNSSPAEFVQRISCWIAEFENGTPPKNSIPGLLTSRDVEGEYHFFVLDQDEGFEQILRRHGALSMKRSSVGLSRAVNAFLAKNHKSQETRS